MNSYILSLARADPSPKTAGGSGGKVRHDWHRAQGKLLLVVKGLGLLDKVEQVH